MTVLYDLVGEDGMEQLEKIASQILEGGEMQKEASAFEKLAYARAEEMLKVAAENLEQAEAGGGEGEEFDNALNVRALEMIDDAGYDPDSVVDAIEGE